MPFLLGKPSRSSWEGNCITVEGWALACAWIRNRLSPFFPVGSLPCFLMAKGPNVFVRKGAGSVSFHGQAASSEERSGCWGPQGWAGLVWKGESRLQGDGPAGATHDSLKQLLNDRFPRVVKVSGDTPFQCLLWGPLNCPVLTPVSHRSLVPCVPASPPGTPFPLPTAPLLP